MDVLFCSLVIFVLMAISCKQVKSWNYYLNLLACGLLVQVGLLLPYLYFPFRPFDHRNANASATYAKKVGNFLGIRYKVKGVENLTKSGGVLLINHQSFLDIIVLAHLWHHIGPTAVIVKKELVYLPPIAFSIWSYGSIFIDRSNKKAALRSLDKASHAIHNDGKKLIFFPEGTRSVSDTLLPFKNGAFASAFNNQCKVFPVVVSKFAFFDHDRKVCTPNESDISILEPVDSTKFTDYSELRDHCQTIMQEEYDRLNWSRAGKNGGE